MSMTMLQIIQAAAGEMGLAVPTYVAGNTQQDVVQLLALLNGLGQQLQREYDWQKFSPEYRFYTQFTQLTGTGINGHQEITGLSSTTGLDNTYQVIGTGVPQDCYIQAVDSSTQVTVNQPLTISSTSQFSFCKTKYSFPDDFDRLIDRTDWDKSRHWEMLGPETNQEWQWLKSGYISTGPRLRFKMLTGYFQIWPPLTTNEYLGIQYVSSHWAQAASGGPQSGGQNSLIADSDIARYPDRLMIDGLKYKYFSVKGFDATEFKADFMRELNIAKANDGGSRTISFAPTISNVLITPENIPDSGFGAPFN